MTPMMPKPKPKQDTYQPLSRRRKLLVLLLAIATGIAVMLMILYPPGGVKRHKPPPPPDAPLCADGQSSDCVGGRVQVLPPASTPAPTTKPAR